MTESAVGALRVGKPLELSGTFPIPRPLQTHKPPFRYYNPTVREDL